MKISSWLQKVIAWITVLFLGFVIHSLVVIHYQELMFEKIVLRTGAGNTYAGATLSIIILIALFWVPLFFWQLAKKIGDGGVFCYIISITLVFCFTRQAMMKIMVIFIEIPTSIMPIYIFTMLCILYFIGMYVMKKLFPEYFKIITFSKTH